MRYSNVKMIGSVSQAAAGAATAGRRPAPGGAVSDIILAVTERQISPGEMACFPFAARTAYGIPSIHDFNVISDNPEWVRLRRSAGDSYGRPCVRAATEPAVTIWPTGQVCVLLENRGSAGIDVLVSIRHRGSDWSKEALGEDRRASGAQVERR